MKQQKLGSQGLSVPIPGTKRRAFLEENAAAVEVQLTAQDVAELNAAVPPRVTAGARYPEAGMAAVNR